MALEYLERAGAKAYGLYANREAANYFQQAIDVLQHVPDDRARLEQAVDLRFKLRNALIALCELDRIERCLDELEPLLATLGDDLRSARHSAFRCNHHFLAGEHRRAIQSGEAGLDIARRCGDLTMQGELLYRVAQSYHALGENDAAIELFRQALDFTAERWEGGRFELSVIPAVVNRTWLVAALVERGDFAEAMTLAKRSLEIAQAADHPLSEVLGWLGIGHTLRRKGELHGAITALERGRMLCDRYSLPIWRVRLLTALGVAYAYSGRVCEGAELAQQALASADGMHLQVDKPMLLVHLGEIALIAGRIHDALEYGRRACDLADRDEARTDGAWARLLSARAAALLEPGDTDPAIEQLREALRLAGSASARPLAALCGSELARLHELRGEPELAREHRARAEATYGALGMRAIVPEPLRAHT